MKFIRSSALLLASAVLACPFLASAQDKKAAPSTAQSGALVSTCIGCHSIPGYQASFPQVYRVPKIGGQSPQYIEAALREYRQGLRSHPTMQGVARNLTDEQIAALAAYYGARGK